MATGRFDDDPLARFLQEDPWGEHPAPFLRGLSWRFVQCVDCGQAFQRNVLNEVWNDRRFTRWMTAEAIAQCERPHRTPERLFLRGQEHTAHILRIAALTAVMRSGAAVRLLDFGCGYGEFINACGLYGFDAHGVDRSAAKRGAGHVQIHPSIESLARVASGASFHVVTLFETLEHLDDPRGVVEALRERLIPGGLLVLETPDCTGVAGIVDRDSYGKIQPLDHINAFTPATLRRFAERLGFEALPKPAAYVTSSPMRVVRTAAKALLAPFLRPTTQQYFRFKG